MKTTLLDQLRQRRLALGIKIQEMPLLAGLTRQQYGKIEAGGNPRLTTLDQIAEGLDCELVLVPKSKLAAIQRILAGNAEPDVEHRYPEPTEQVVVGTQDIESPWGDI